MANNAGSFTKLPEGWQKCVSTFGSIKTATHYANIWNNRNDGYFYKIFPKFVDRETTYIIARKLKSEL